MPYLSNDPLKQVERQVRKFMCCDQKLGVCTTLPLFDKENAHYSLCISYLGLHFFFFLMWQKDKVYCVVSLYVMSLPLSLDALCLYERKLFAVSL